VRAIDVDERGHAVVSVLDLWWSGRATVLLRQYFFVWLNVVDRYNAVKRSGRIAGSSTTPRFQIRDRALKTTRV
jgi:hypothetical protein